MSKIICSIALMLVCFSTNAQYLNERELCDFYSEYAKQTMESRQNGGKASNHIKVLTEFKTLDDDVKKSLESIVMSAYSRPRYDTPKNKAKAIRDFENDVYVKCIK